MSSIPDPREAQELRALFAENPVIDAIEKLYREHGGLGDQPLVRDVLALLEAGAGMLDASPLTERERRAVMARFTPEPSDRCGNCGGLIEYVTEGPMPGWWRHLEHSVLPHPAVPHYTSNREMRGAGMCTETVDDGKRVCGNPITDEVSWPDPASPGDLTVKLVCSTCADWLMGAGASWLMPTRVRVSDSEHGDSGPGGAL